VAAVESVRGRVAFITGANSGIGRATAIRFAQEGVNVALAARRAEQLVEVEGLCREAGAEVVALPSDVTDRPAIDRIVAAAIERWGRLDVLVASAGMNFTRRRLEQASVDEYTRLFDVNVNGVFHSAQASLEPMRRSGGGLMILVSSMAAKRQSSVTGPAYTASKHALTGMGQAIAAEEQANNIRVTVFYPGAVNTPILQVRPRPPAPEQLPRAIQPEDCAETFLFLARLPARCTVPELMMVPTDFGPQ
jgi:NADP-dependent 3-hydroxy acid dehydrogenase YdfG